MNEQERSRDEELRVRIEEYEACEGFKIRIELRAFRTGHDIFLGNYGELKKALAQGQDPRVWPYLWDPKHRDRVVQYNREIARLLHNYVTAVKSLVEHTRNFMRAKYAGKVFLKEYQDRIDKDFKHDPLSQFLEDLRNYVLHKNIFAASLTLRASGEGYARGSHVALDVAQIRGWKRLSPEGRKYLETLADDARLEEPIDAYREKVMNFWMWIGPRLGQEHIEEFREMAILEDRIREVDPKWETGYGETYTAKGRGS
jgi:hypothetical protein